MEELLPCPFCGSAPRLENGGIRETRSRDNGDLITSWKVSCVNCGAERDGGVSEYIFTKDERLEVRHENFDGRKKAIESWNKRA